MGRRRITLDLDEDVLAAADQAAAERRQSRNQYVIDSLHNALRQAERERIDAAFERMAEDPDYRSEVLSIERDLSPASDAAWSLIDAAERRPQ